MTNIEINKKIVAQMRFSGQKLAYATAIFCQKKISELSASEIEKLRPRAEKIINEFLVYIGDYSSNASVLLKQIILPELQRYYGKFTFEELELAIPDSLRHSFGNHTKAVPSMAFLSDIIKIYDNSDFRKELVVVYQQVRGRYSEVDFMTQDQKNQLSKKLCLQGFEKYKSSPADYIHECNWAVYEIIQEYAAVPDFNDFMEDAKVVEPKVDRGEKIKSIADLLPVRSFENKAKGLAVRNLYDRLIEQGMSLEKYIETK